MYTLLYKNNIHLHRTIDYNIYFDRCTTDNKMYTINGVKHYSEYNELLFIHYV